MNWQNRKRGGRMEQAIEAPPGHMVVVNDASQIECRILNQVAGQHDVLERFRNHEDPYVALRDAFNAAKRQLEDYAQIRRGETRSRKRQVLGDAAAAPSPPDAV